MRRTPVLIIGGGPAGAAAAITLARGGHAPELIERTPGPRDTVCGGFLGWDALGALKALGIDAAALGARPIHRVRMVAGTRVVEADLPHEAAGLSRRTLDAALLAAAETAGTRISRGRAVRAADPVSRTVRLDDEEEIACNALFLATGKHELRGAARALEGRGEELAVGLRTALPATAARERMLAGYIELHLFDEGYAGLLLQEDGTTNLCLSVSRRRLGAAGGTLPLLMQIAAEAPVLGERVADGLQGQFEAIAGVPYGWRARETQPGVFRIGDQSAVIASLAGDGVAIALTSGIGAASAMLTGGTAAAPAWQRSYRRQSALPLALAQMLRHAAERKRQRAAMMQLLTFVPGLVSVGAGLTRISRT